MRNACRDRFDGARRYDRLDAHGLKRLVFGSVPQCLLDVNGTPNHYDETFARQTTRCTTIVHYPLGADKSYMCFVLAPQTAESLKPCQRQMLLHIEVGISIDTIVAKGVNEQLLFDGWIDTLLNCQREVIV